jgi:transcriptional regulator with XRE-family HTH domain
MASGSSNPVRYFGLQVRKARLAAGWTLAEFGQRAGYDPAHLGRIENGKRPATKLIAEMCDQAFPERAGWFGEFYEESRTWIATPPWFRDWVDREQRASTLRNWYLGVVDGLLQTEDYACTIQGVTPGVTEDEVNGRVAARMKRQAILTSENPPTAWFLLDWRSWRLSLVCRTSRSRLCPRSLTPASSAGSLSPRALLTWKPQSQVRYSKTLKSSPACSPASIRSGTRR